jgi:hypothetical protein
MARYEHPVSADYMVRSMKGVTPRPNKRTVFLEVECDNYGALVGRTDDGSLTPNIQRGIFNTTIWEFETALELNLIRNVKIHTCIDFFRRTNFEEFSIPIYNERMALKDQLDAMEKAGGNSNLIDELAREIIILKFLLNNAYGKTAQNPRNFKEWLYTDYDEPPPGEYAGGLSYKDDDGGIWELDSELTGQFSVWKKPVQTLRFNNVATGASITGAARAELLRKIHSSKNPIYCDTDCVISQNTERTMSNELGAWKAETEIDQIAIAGKKLYSYRNAKNGKYSVKSKGGKGLIFQDIVSIVNGKTIVKKNPAPNIRKNGEQRFEPRSFMLTCPHEYRSRIFEA